MFNSAEAGKIAAINLKNGRCWFCEGYAASDPDEKIVHEALYQFGRDQIETIEIWNGKEEKIITEF